MVSPPVAFPTARFWETLVRAATTSNIPIPQTLVHPMSRVKDVGNIVEEAARGGELLFADATFGLKCAGRLLLCSDSMGHDGRYIASITMWFP